MKTAVDVIILTFQRGALVPPPAGAHVLVTENQHQRSAVPMYVEAALCSITLLTQIHCSEADRAHSAVAVSTVEPGFVFALTSLCVRYFLLRTNRFRLGFLFMSTFKKLVTQPQLYTATYYYCVIKRLNMCSFYLFSEKGTYRLI